MSLCSLLDDSSQVHDLSLPSDSFNSSLPPSPSMFEDLHSLSTTPMSSANSTPTNKQSIGIFTEFDPSINSIDILHKFNIKYLYKIKKSPLSARILTMFNTLNNREVKNYSPLYFIQKYFTFILYIVALASGLLIYFFNATSMTFYDIYNMYQLYILIPTIICLLSLFANTLYNLYIYYIWYQLRVCLELYSKNS